MQKTILSCVAALLALNFSVYAQNLAPKSKFATRGPMELRQLVVPGFDQLPLERKLFVYYLSEAIEAGRDIAWLQLSPQGLEIRKLFENIWAKKDQLDSHERAAIEEYYFMLIANHGIYDANTNTKNTLKKIGQEAFVRLLRRLDLDPEAVAGLLPAIFDKSFEPKRLAEEGEDLTAKSGVNFYGPGITQTAMEQLPVDQKLHPLSYPVLGEDGKIHLEIFKIDGRFGAELKRVDFYLDQAMPYARPEERKLIEQYRKAFRTGAPEDALEADRIWVKLPAYDLTFHFGFTETYDDPYQVRPTWEGMVMLHNQDPEAKAVSDRVRASAPAYEAKMPVDPEFIKQGEFTPPQSEAAYLLHMGGGGTETFFAGVNLPNDNEIREKLGSKSFTMYNRVNNLGESPGSEFTAEDLDAFYLPEYHELLKRYGKVRPSMLQVEFHEILGHGSGRDRDGVDSTKVFADLFAGLEESRAELASLYQMTDYTALVNNQLVPPAWTDIEAKDFAQVVLLNFFTNQLDSYRKLKGRTIIRQAHQVGRQIILNHLLNEGALKISLSDKNVPRVKLGSIEEIRTSLGRLWAQEQRIKSTGDIAGLKKMMADLALMTPDQIQWAVDITKAANALDRPEKLVNMNPFVVLVRDSAGNAVDVKLDYPEPELGMEALFLQEQRRVRNDRERECEIMFSKERI